MLVRTVLLLGRSDFGDGVAAVVETGELDTGAEFATRVVVGAELGGSTAGSSAGGGSVTAAATAIADSVGLGFTAPGLPDRPARAVWIASVFGVVL